MNETLHKCQMNPRIIRLLTAIAEMIGTIEGVKLNKPAPTLRKTNRIRTIQSSLSIEGNSLTQDQVTALIDEKPVIGPSQDIIEVNNAIRVYRQIGKLNPLTLKSLLNAHSVLMDGLLPSNGRLRQEPIGVIRPGDIFHENGGMGRLWQTRLLMEYHPIFEFLPVEDLIKQNQDEYYRKLAVGDDTGDCTGFVELMLGLVRESLGGLIAATRSVTLNAMDRLEIAAQAIGKASFSRKDYQAFFKTISTATASRDLQQGVKMGLLVKSGDKRTTRYKIVKG